MSSSPATIDKSAAAPSETPQRPMASNSAAWQYSDLELASTARVESPALWIVLLVFVAVSFRLLIFVLGPAGDIDRAIIADAPRQIELAQSLTSDGAFRGSEPAEGTAEHYIMQWQQQRHELPADPTLAAEHHHLPGYPMLIAAMSMLGLPLAALLLLQCLLGGAAVLLVYAWTHALFKKIGAGLLAGGIVAVHPLAVLSPAAVAADVLLVVLTLGGLAVASWPSLRRGLPMAGAGLALGLAALVKPAALLAGPVVALWLIFSSPRKQSVALAAALLVSSMLPMGFWMMRNHTHGVGPRVSTAAVVQGVTESSPALLEKRAQRQQELAPSQLSLSALLIDTAAQNAPPDQPTYTALARANRRIAAAQPTDYTQWVAGSLFARLTDHHVRDAYSQLGLRYEQEHAAALSPPQLARALHDTPDRATLGIELSWLSFNALLLLGTLAGFVLLAMRRKWAELLLLGGLGVSLGVVGVIFGMDRLHGLLLCVQAVVIGSMLIDPPPPKPRPRRQGTWKQRLLRRFERDVDPERASVLHDPDGRPI